MSTQATQPQVDRGEAPPCWPPLGHLIPKCELPVKEGSIALCGQKLMGIDLQGAKNAKVCPKCVEIARSGGFS